MITIRCTTYGKILLGCKFFFVVHVCTVSLHKAHKISCIKISNSLSPALKLSFMNIQGLRSNFVDCESFFESNSRDILALCETHLDGSIDSGNFSGRGYLPLIQKDSTTHARSHSLYEG